MFAITNNDQNDVTLAKILDDAALLACHVWQGQARTQALAAGVRISAGGVLLVSCDAVRAGTGNVQLQFTGGAGSNLKNIPVTVYAPGANAALYPGTPWGRAMPFLSKPEPPTPPASTTVTTAPENRIDFADPAPDIGVATDKKAEEKAKAEKARQDALKQSAQQLLAGQVASFDFRFCKTYFCSFDQSRVAMDTFLQSFSALVKQQYAPAGASEPTLESLGQFCRQIQGGGKFRKSMLLQLSNVEASSTQRQDIQGRLAAQAGQLLGLRSVQVTLDDGPDVVFSGCGIYQLEATLNPSCASPGASVSEWKSKMALEVRGKKLASCPVTLENAALLTADEPVAYTGNKVGDPNLGKRALVAFRDAALALKDTPQVFGTIISAPNDHDKLALSLRAIGQLRQGVLGPFGETSDPADEKTTQQLYAALFNAKPGAPAGMCVPVYGQTVLAQRACPAVKYEDTHFCWREGGPVFGTLLASQAAVTVLQSFAAAAQLGSPLSIPIMIKAAISNYRVISTTAACTASFVHAGGASCDFLSQCTSAVLAGLVESLPLPGSWSVLGAAGSLRGATVVGTFVSSFGNYLLQSAAGYGALYGIDHFANAQEAPVPVVPITIAARYPAAAAVSGAGTVVRYTVQPVKGILGGGGRQKAIDDAVRQLEQKGVTSAQGRRIASRAVAVLHDAGAGTVGAGFANPLIKAINSQDDAGVAEFRRRLNSPIGGDRKALGFLAEKV
ncbi:MAG: hypothetical protein Q8P02_00220, partial [Candidatus Micrarchaeota archaeon]|nr:hypothetical protein [Candidatus Micrarchaeota archaeon]